MKQKFTHIQLILFSLILFISCELQAQPDYVFTGGVLESGTDLQVGAVYRFKEVKPGVDGIITIVDMTGGMTLAELDGPSGFDEAFQPYIYCEGSQRGYVEFQLDFVDAGTNTPAIMTEVPLTAIDIDGYKFPDDFLYEFDEFETSPSFYTQYDLLGNDLIINNSGGWVESRNTNGITYNGIDTIQRNVMFSAIHANVTSVRFRVGAENRSVDPMKRLRSVYFKKFYFNTGLLAAPGLKSFNAVTQNNQVQLGWELVAGSNIRSIVIERSSDARIFTSISNKSVDYSEMARNQVYQDAYSPNVATYYRLKLTDTEGKITYSNVLVVKGKTSSGNGFKVYPNIVQSNTTINLFSETREQASLTIVDISGRMIRKNVIQVQSGNNSLQINDLEKLNAGNYVMVIDLQGKRYAQQFVKR
jgi:Secretion system C-terminal sorting domain